MARSMLSTPRSMSMPRCTRTVSTWPKPLRRTCWVKVRSSSARRDRASSSGPLVSGSAPAQHVDRHGRVGQRLVLRADQAADQPGHRGRVGLEADHRVHIGQADIEGAARNLQRHVARAEAALHRDVEALAVEWPRSTAARKAACRPWKAQSSEKRMGVRVCACTDPWPVAQAMPCTARPLGKTGSRSDGPCRPAPVALVVRAFGSRLQWCDPHLRSAPPCWPARPRCCAASGIR